MSAVAKRWASRQHIADGSMKGVIQALAYLHQDGAELFPSQTRLAEETGISDRSVRDALVVLEHFGVISLQRRSRGWYARSSDRFQLTMDRDFTLSRKAITLARKALSNRKNLPGAAGNDPSLQPAKFANATGEIFRGIVGEQKKEASHGKHTSEVEVEHTREARPRLAVVVGGRS